jgi:RNA polymerase sigma-70 factor (ECF subfamily)
VWANVALRAARRPHHEPGGWTEVTSARPDAARDDDARLVERAAGGDRDALGALYDRFAPLLRGVARRMLHGEREAEDLVHDVFLEAWRNAGDYDPARAPVRAWLLLYLRSRALDRMSAARRATAAIRCAAEAPRPAGADDPSLAPDRSAAARALARLPLEQRRVLELGYFEGLSASEIAHVTASPIGTVKSRTAAALAKLRAQLEDPEGHP